MPFRYTAAVFCASIALASISIQRTGWLDRLVNYHKIRFYNEILSAAPLDIEASIQQAPPGFVDSPLWNIHSVLHLLRLIGESKACIATRVTLTRMLRPTRRLMMSKHHSYKLFPSLSKGLHNVMYYDAESDADYADEIVEQVTGVPDDDAVIVVSNPVEARLPSAQISVKLLREILEARALAGRVMPPTTRTPIPWKTMNVTSGDATAPGDSASDTKGTASDGATGASDSTGAGTEAAAATTSHAAAP